MTGENFLGWKLNKALKKYTIFREQMFTNKTISKYIHVKSYFDGFIVRNIMV